MIEAIRRAIKRGPDHSGRDKACYLASDHTVSYERDRNGRWICSGQVAGVPFVHYLEKQ